MKEQAKGSEIVAKSIERVQDMVRQINAATNQQAAGSESHPQRGRADARGDEVRAPGDRRAEDRARSMISKAAERMIEMVHEIFGVTPTRPGRARGSSDDGAGARDRRRQQELGRRDERERSICSPRRSASSTSEVRKFKDQRLIPPRGIPHRVRDPAQERDVAVRPGISENTTFSTLSGWHASSSSVKPSVPPDSGGTNDDHDGAGAARHRQR